RGDAIDDNPPVVPVEAAERDRPYSLKEAAAEVSDGHRMQWASHALRNARAIVGNSKPVTEAEARQYERDVHVIQTGMPQKPSEIGFNPTGLIEDGKFVKPLKDDEKIGLDHALNPRQAAKQLGDFREWQRQAQDELARTLQDQESQRQVVEAAQA